MTHEEELHDPPVPLVDLAVNRAKDLKFGLGPGRWRRG